MQQSTKPLKNLRSHNLLLLENQLLIWFLSSLDKQDVQCDVFHLHAVDNLNNNWVNNNCKFVASNVVVMQLLEDINNVRLCRNDSHKAMCLNNINLRRDLALSSWHVCYAHLIVYMKGIAMFEMIHTISQNCVGTKIRIIFNTTSKLYSLFHLLWCLWQCFILQDTIIYCT